MMKGTVNSELEAILRLSVHGPSGAIVEIGAIIDTGFNGFLTLPRDIAEQLQLPWLFRQQGELADGSIHIFDVHGGTVSWNEDTRAIEIEIAETEPLLGMAMLQKHVLTIDVVADGVVSAVAHR